jgi:hypothetical protein
MMGAAFPWGDADVVDVWSVRVLAADEDWASPGEDGMLAGDNGRPQLLQNFASSRFGVLHDGQFISIFPSKA